MEREEMDPGDDIIGNKFKSLTDTQAKTNTIPLTRVRSRDASASKNGSWG